MPIAAGLMFRASNDTGLIQDPWRRPLTLDAGLQGVPPTPAPIWFGEVGETPLAAVPLAQAAPVPTAALPAGELALVSYVSGLTASGALADNATNPSFASWNGNSTTPAYSGANGVAHRWGASAGTDPTVDLYFDPLAAWSSAEVTAFEQGYSLWSDVADVSFVVVTTIPADGITITRGAPGSGANTSANYGYNTSPPYSIGIMTGAEISIDTSTYGWQALDSYAAADGYGPMTVVHEEGHSIGLGHDGPYNGSAITPNGIYDSRQYSVMSYFDDPNEMIAGATYYPTTPMMTDIAAAQRLYGAPTKSALSGGQVFGFHTNTGLQAYDFTVDTEPVVTIFDTGADNTLDLSGFTGPATIDLRAGGYSSTAGMIDNIGIYPGVAVDTAIGTSGGTAFWVNGDSDTLIGQGQGNTVMLPQAASAYTIKVVNSATTLATQGVTVDTLVDIQNLVFNACFVPETLIATPGGETPAGTLHAGDLVLTASGEALPIRWVGRRRVAARQLREDASRRPIRFAAGALGPGCPRRALIVSPLHAIRLDGVLVPAELLVNGGTIRRLAPRGAVDYVHIELPRHDILLAEGAPAESFIDLDSRWLFENAAEAPPGGPREECARRLTADDPDLAAIRRRLGSGVPGRWRGVIDAEGPGAMWGWAINDANPLEPALLRVEAPGVAPGVTLAQRFRADLAEAGLGDGCLAFRLPFTGPPPRLYLPDGAPL